MTIRNHPHKAYYTNFNQFQNKVLNFSFKGELYLFSLTAVDISVHAGAVACAAGNCVVDLFASGNTCGRWMTRMYLAVCTHMNVYVCHVWYGGVRNHSCFLFCFLLCCLPLTEVVINCNNSISLFGHICRLWGSIFNSDGFWPQNPMLMESPVSAITLTDRFFSFHSRTCFLSTLLHSVLPFFIQMLNGSRGSFISPTLFALNKSGDIYQTKGPDGYLLSQHFLYSGQFSAVILQTDSLRFIFRLYLDFF